MKTRQRRAKRRALAFAAAAAAVLFLLLTAPLCFATSDEPEASLLNASCVLTTADGGEVGEGLLDGDEDTYEQYAQQTEFRLISPSPVKGLYVRFDRVPPPWTLLCGDRTIECGQYGFIHEYVDIPCEDLTDLTLTFSDAVTICDIFVFSKGALPDYVQRWRPAEGNADVMVFPTHSDDDQLFFAGTIPDAVARGAEVQVCYFVNHWAARRRPHELLNGLWTCGVDRYPTMGVFDDYWAKDEAEGVKRYNKDGYTLYDITEEQVKLIRKYKPQVILVHDVNGEYGHGVHVLCSHAVRDAVCVAGNARIYPDSAAAYGTWDPPKTYVHLWTENQVEVDLDTPLAYFGGRTAYQVSQDAFLCHKSQVGKRYYEWLFGTEEQPVTESAGFYKYSPKYFGLWRSTVGADTDTTTFYDHIVFYAAKEEDVTTETPPETETPSVDETPTETPAAETPAVRTLTDGGSASPDSEEPQDGRTAAPFPWWAAIIPAAGVLTTAGAVIVLGTRKKKEE